MCCFKLNDYWVYPGYVSTFNFDISYSAVLQQITRHRSFAFSVQSSRASEMNMGFVPHFQAHGGNRMFSATELGRFRLQLAKTIWMLSKLTARGFSFCLKSLGVHRQHYQLIVKPYSMVSVFMSGSDYAWDHFINLRTDKNAQIEIRHLAESIRDVLFSERSVWTSTLDQNVFYGPFINGFRIGIDAYKCFIGDKPSQEGYILARAVARVGRISTSKHSEDLSDEDALRWVRRAYRFQHSSVFEHHWVALSGHRSGPFVNTVSLRELLGL